MKVFVARTSAEIDEAFTNLTNAEAVGCDTETSGLNSKYGRLFSIQFSDGVFNVLVPLSEGVELGKLAALLTNEKIVKIFHNAKFDLEFLSASNIAVENIFDTMIAEKVLTRGANQSASLAETLYRYFAVDLDKSQRAKFTRKWDGIWTDELVDYALSDVVYLPKLMSEQTAWLEKQLANTKAVWKFVSYHHPAYSSGGNRDNVEVRQLWTPLFDKYHVDLALQGHDHAYLRTYPMRDQKRVASAKQGTIYIISVSGIKYYEQGPHDYTEVGLTKLSTYQVLDIQVSGNRLVYRAHDVDGKVHDQFVIEKEPQPVSRR